MVKENQMKQTEIGLIPEDWEMVKIKEISSIKTGSKNTQDRIENGKYFFFVRSQTIERINSYSYDEEAVLTAGDGVGVGKVFHYVNEKFDLHQRVYLMHQFRKDVSGFYFFKYFQNNFLGRVMQMTAKSSVDSVRMETISEMPIPLPPLPEQKAIAAALSDCDAWIESLEAVIAKKRHIKQGAMQELLTPKDDWEVKKLGECLLKTPDYGINAAAVKYSDNLPTYLRITDIGENGEFLKSNVVSVRHSLSQNYILEENDICIARTGASVGKSYFHSSFNGKLIFAGFLIRLKVDSSILNSKLLFYITKSKKYDDFILSNSMRSGQPGINSSELQSFIISFPKSLSEQTRIATVLSDMDAELKALGQKLNKARQIKQGMMQELLTGRVRLV